MIADGVGERQPRDYIGRMKGTLRAYRQAVRRAMEDLWAAGLPVIQGRSGYMVAIYPDGRQVKLQKLAAGGDSAARRTKALAARRAQRRR